MSTSKIDNALNDIDDELIADAASYRHQKNNWIKWAAVAACLIIVSIGGYLLAHKKPVKSEETFESVIAFLSGNVYDANIVSSYVPVADRAAIYNQIYEGNETADEKVKAFVGDVFFEAAGVNYYSVRGKEDYKYLISLGKEDEIKVWQFNQFMIDGRNGDAASLRELFPDADFSSYTYDDVFKTIYHLNSVDDIESITAAPSQSNNTSFGLELQKRVGTHTYDAQQELQDVYSALQGLTSNDRFWEAYNENNEKYTYSFSTDSNDKLSSGEETLGTRVVTIQLKNGTSIEGLKYYALNGIFYENGGICTEPLTEEEVNKLNTIFGIE